MGYPRVPMASLWLREVFVWPNGGNKANCGNVQAKKKKNQKNTLSFLLHYCHSFRITVISSGLLSFLPYQSHSFRILSFLLNYCHYLSSWIRSSGTLPYPKGEKIGRQSRPYLRVCLIYCLKIRFSTFIADQYSSPQPCTVLNRDFDTFIQNSRTFFDLSKKS